LFAASFGREPDADRKGEDMNESEARVSYSFDSGYLVLLLHLTELSGWLALA
jgi:hypothetical protein